MWGSSRVRPIRSLRDAGRWVAGRNGVRWVLPALGLLVASYVGVRWWRRA